MGMPAPQRITTVEELLELPETHQHHELLEGQYVVTPRPTIQHQRAVREFYEALRHAFSDQASAELFCDSGDIILGPRTLLQPDLFVLPRDPDRPVTSWREAPVPLLVVEILSPSTAARDRGKKRKLYLEAGVAEYWIVDLAARVVERWRQGDERPEIVDRTLTWSLSAGVSGAVDLPAVFEKVGETVRSDE